jgi:translation initiation factor 2 beta subunit (eIF-2beta)/eIF-5
MSLLRGNTVNMDGSAEAGYRYTMPALVVKHEGSSKMKKSVLVNLSEVSRAVGRPAEHVLTYLGQSLSAANKIEKEKAYIAGHHNPNVVQQQIFTFVRDFVMCQHCSSPETCCSVEGSKKNKMVFLVCKTCGRRRDLDSTSRFVKYVAQHPPQDAVQGHAQVAGSTASAVMERMAELADAQQAGKAESDEKKKRRHRCPNPDCGHKTSKTVCSKCGTYLVEGDDDFGTSEGDGCRACIRQWMQDHKNESISSESVHDFDCAIKSFDFRALPSRQLADLIEIMVDDTIAEYDLNTDKLQPVMVSEKASPFVERWSPLIDNLYSKIDDAQEAIDIIISSLKKAIVGITPPSEDTNETLLIGCLLSLRGVDAVGDEDVLAGCCKIKVQSKAMKQFIKFLKSNDTDDEDGAS